MINPSFLICLSTITLFLPPAQGDWADHYQLQQVTTGEIYSQTEALYPTLNVKMFWII